MSEQLSVEIQPRTFGGLLLILGGLLLLGYVIFMAYGLFNGTVDVIPIGEDPAYSPQTSLLLGVILQVGTLGILMVAAAILLRYGIEILQKPSQP